jgi:hypothetical protein
MTETFVTALSELHKNGQVGPLVELFADVSRVFDDIDATFTHADTEDNLAPWQC